MSDTYQRFRNEVLAGGATEEAGPDGTIRGPRAFVGIGIILGLLAILAVASIWAFVFVVGILISVFLHEMGHFLTARRTGMKVTQLFMGMGPKLWSFRRGEVEYGVRAFPIGAFVRIVGMNNLDPVEPGDEPRAYSSQSFPRRLLVITAGSLMHVVIAIVLLFGVFALKGRYEESGRVSVVTVVEGAAASRAGLRDGDVIVALDGERMTTAGQLVDAIGSTPPGTTVTIDLLRDGQPVTITPTLEQNPSFTTEAVGYLGVRPRSVELDDKSVVEALGLAFTDLAPQAWNSVEGVVKAMNPVNMIEHLTGKTEDINSRPANIFTVAKVSGEFGDQEGIAGVLLLLAGVNVFVGVFNMFPLLPFDGGHAAIAIYERLRSRPGKPYRADVGKMMPVAMTVMALLAFLLFTSLYLDVTKPL